ncbi:uncharacterized protein CBL_02676 [Carabus blaptoides fortunei]
MSVKLLSGNTMPLIGFGTFQIRGRQLIYDVLNNALNAGFRSFDTAAVYGNEQDIGLALKELLPKYSLQREDVFITSKLSPSDHADRVETAIERSLSNLGLRYLDLYLIHWPGASGIPVDSTDNRALRSYSWKALVKAKQKGYLKAIGVSNYTIRHMQELLSNCYGVKPDVNQVEWHPHYHQTDLLDLCRKEGVLLQAYSSLGSSNDKTLLRDPVVNSVAKKLNKSPAQILLRWALQQGVGIIPKARSKEHIEDNIKLNFVISEEDVNLLNNIKKDDKYAWDPTVVV